MNTQGKEIQAFSTPWLDLFEKEPGYQDFPKQVSSFRAKGIEAFRETGFPATKNEEWKYSSVLPLLKLGIPPALSPSVVNLQARDLGAFIPAGLECNRLVFLNGFFSEVLSEIKDTGDGIQMGSLKSWLQAHPEDIEKLGSLAQEKNEAFSALSAAFFRDGAHIRIPEGAVLEKPVVVLWLHDTLGGNLSWNVRNLYETGKGASAEIIHCYGFLGAGKGLANMVNEIFVGDNAHLAFSQLQTAHHPGWLIEKTEIAQGRDTTTECITLSGGPEFSRNDLNIRLKGENGEARLFGLYLGSDQRHMDNHTLVDHTVPNCFSEELYKGVLGGKSSAVFNGKVFVRKNAQKTNAFQSNRNLLLSESATVNTKPQLEIYADDVKCSHGATTGQLDSEALFYLRSRGVGEMEAKKLLSLAFANEIVEKLGHPALQESVEKMVIKTLG